MSKKRTLDTFFQPTYPKRARIAGDQASKSTQDATTQLDGPYDNHATYPYKIPHFTPQIANALTEVPAAEGKEINDQPDLDLLYFQPYIPKSIEKDLFEFLRQELFFYRVQYKIKRGSVETQINTPR